uniref:Uncharacterized protein n=1 Tax=Loxodonta africana TaxID=9785 RepID=G3TUX7_LOXAF
REAVARVGALTGAEPDPVEELAKLVSRVCTQLDNHLGIDFKDLAKFVNSLAENNTFDNSKVSLVKHGTEFTYSLINNLLHFIQTMGPLVKPSTSKDPVVKPKTEKEKMKELFLHLCQTDNPPIGNILGEDDVKVAVDVLKDLEALMPRAAGAEVKRPSKDRKDQ